MAWLIYWWIYWVQRLWACLHSWQFFGRSSCSNVLFEKTRKRAKMILTGSSGLFENAFGNSFPRRSSRDYIRKKNRNGVFDPKVATEALVDEVFDSVSDLGRCIRIVKTINLQWGTTWKISFKWSKLPHYLFGVYRMKWHLVGWSKVSRTSLTHNW